MSQNLRKRNIRYEPKGHVNNDQLTYLPSSLNGPFAGRSPSIYVTLLLPSLKP